LFGDTPKGGPFDEAIPSEREKFTTRPRPRNGHVQGEAGEGSVLGVLGVSCSREVSVVNSFQDPSLTSEFDHGIRSLTEIQPQPGELLIMLRSSLMRVSAIALTTLLLACSTQYEVLREEQQEKPKLTLQKKQKTYTYSQLLEELEGCDAQVVMIDEQEWSGSDFSIRNDSLMWTSPDDKRVRSARLSDVHSIVTKDRLLGGVKGFLLGTVGGAAVTFLAVVGSSGHELEGFIVGIAVGSLVIVGGTIAGVIIGHPYEYLFVEDSAGVER